MRYLKEQGNLAIVAILIAKINVCFTKKTMELCFAYKMQRNGEIQNILHSRQFQKKKKMFLSCVDGRAKYLGRHCGGELYVSMQKPRLVSGTWGCCVTVKVPEEIFGNMFTFIRNNEEPWPIAELLKLEVEA